MLFDLNDLKPSKYKALIIPDYITCHQLLPPQDRKAYIYSALSLYHQHVFRSHLKEFNALNKYLIAVGKSPTILFDKLFDQNYGNVFKENMSYKHKYTTADKYFRMPYTHE